MEEQQIIKLLNERSEQGIDELHKKYGKLLRQISFNILNDELDAEECLNDTYLAIWNSILPENPHPLLTYAAKIIRNLSLKKYHSNTAKKRNSSYDIVIDELEDFLSAGEAPEDIINAKEISAAVNHFLDLLDYDDRYMFLRRYWYAEPVKNIAVAMKNSPNRVSIRLSRTRNNLKNYLKKEGLL